ncbi:hypothetical protein ACGFYU_19295 [Streptomyces sp. NPDC048337]|uniref:hypothetical protein n=1 Tax=Streptomyces sp. NPDC048337 TaxID=3365535 RepID=UPI003721BA0F
MSSRPHGFEDRLKAALLARLPETPAPAPVRSRARRYGIPLAVGVATAAVVAVMGLPGSSLHGPRPAKGPTDAPEIRKDPDGSLRFDLPENDQVPSLVERLKELGVQAVVVPKRPQSQCSELGGGYRGPQADPEAEIMPRGGDGPFLKVNAKTVPPGYTLTFTWSEYYPLGEQGVGFGVIETSKVPSCSMDQSEGLEELLKSGSKDPGPTIEVPRPTKADELPELVRRLQAQGVSVAVTEKKPQSECPHLGGGYRGPQADPEAELTFPRGSSTLRINAKTVPPGYTLVFTKGTPSNPYIGAGVQETSKVTPCQIDFSLLSPEEEAKRKADMDRALQELRERGGTGSEPPVSPSRTRAR